jgi:hypothetical protein
VGDRLRSSFRSHGLADGDAEWQYKSAVYGSLRERYAERSARPSSVRQRPSRIRHPLKAANAILKSPAAAIPGVGGALAELKDSTEAAIDDAIDNE